MCTSKKICHNSRSVITSTVMFPHRPPHTRPPIRFVVVFRYLNDAKFGFLTETSPARVMLDPDHSVASQQPRTQKSGVCPFELPPLPVFLFFRRNSRTRKVRDGDGAVACAYRFFTVHGGQWPSFFGLARYSMTTIYLLESGDDDFSRRDEREKNFSEAVANGMRKKGYRRTPDQCRKYKDLVSRYKVLLGAGTSLLNLDLDDLSTRCSPEILRTLWLMICTLSWTFFKPWGKGKGK
ncbi:50S ribosomal protein L11 [Striga asiatica]|uniref:50S ribosomal protein L11 n=1 Tax=Striga asiatica TaxID=4170 RepID=A0A5A7Q2V8_STRAF|nr:50S ribosomal protein L11 [Striga asiatica]